MYHDVFSGREKLTLAALVAANVIAGLSLIGWLLWPTHLPHYAGGTTLTIFAFTAVILMVVIEGIRLAQCSALALFASRAQDPQPIKPKPGQRVAILTTIVPGKEPLDLVVRTLRAMKKIEHNGTMDVWLLDEGNDPKVKAACAAIGVNHFSRKGIPGYNQESGAFRAKTKHGNHNAWRDANEDNYDLVAQMDPDHVPTPDFLLRTVGYFNDQDVAFVVAPQVYGNLNVSWIARGAAILAYVFHGIIQRGGNGMRAPLMIGTNHLYRVTTFIQIGGYQDSIIEDHLTSMKIYATKNPDTGKYWQGVYTPDILAVGEGPSTFTDFFTQQKRWAYGIWEIMLKHSPRLFPQMKRSQQLSFSLLQFYYPSVALNWILSIALSMIFLLSGVRANLSIRTWCLLWGASITANLSLWFWLRRFNLVEHERRDTSLIGMGLTMMCIPIYTAAAIARLAGRPLAYQVTAKGDLTSPDGLNTFRLHLYWAGAFVAMLITSFTGFGSAYPSWRIWTIVGLMICISPMIIHYGPSGLRKIVTAPKRAYEYVTANN